MSRWPLTLLAIGAVVVGGCGRRRQPEPPAGASAPGSAPIAASSAVQRRSRSFERSDWLPGLGDCQIWHRGIFLDLGTPGPNGLRDFNIGPFPETQDVERGGATLVRVFGKRVAYDFWLDQDQAASVFVAARLHGVGARSLWAEIDGRRMGTARLTADKTEVVTLPAVELALTRGRHSLVLHFTGQARDVAVPAVELDWLRIATADDLEETFAPPALEDIVTNYELGGQPRRSLVLRAPSTVRCTLLPAPDARLVTSLGFWGSGKGTAEVRVVEDGQVPVTLQQRRVIGGADARWLPLGIDLGPYQGRVVGIELSAIEATPGGRIVFGDPSVVRKSPPRPEMRPAKTVVLVLASGLDRRRIPPWGPMGKLTALGELVRSGVAFSNYRVPTTIPAAVVASVLSGLEPHSHALEDPSARLPEAVRTVSEIVKAATGRTAFFTGVPSTFSPFGFTAGWDHFETFSPVQDLPATAPYERATQWLEETSAAGAARRFLVVHVRGAHPPWDLSAEEVARLPPEEYGGAIDPRRGGVTLARLRGRSTRTQRKLADEDWVRLRALEDAALAKQNDGLSKLIDTLKRLGAWEDTLLVYAGDVALGDPLRLPFDAAAPLTDDVLLTPLLVKFPGGSLAGTEAKVPVTSADLAVTVLDSLGLDVPTAVAAHHVFPAAAGQEPLVGRALVSTLGPTYVTRANSWLLSGELGKPPKLCQLDVDPACTTDLLQEKPLVSQWLWRATYRYLNATVAPGRRVGDREPASIDPGTAAALLVWGDIQ
jgi:arylsulfatase A-like enzyme